MSYEEQRAKPLPWQSETGEDGGKDCASGANSSNLLIY